MPGGLWTVVRSFLFMNDCEDTQCKQVHNLLDALLARLGHMGSHTAPSASKSAILSELIRELEKKAERPVSAADFVKYWDGLDFKQHCLLSAQSLLKAASLVE